MNPTIATGQMKEMWAFSTGQWPTFQRHYLVFIRDPCGRLLDGAKNFRLTLPANLRLRPHWSALIRRRGQPPKIRQVVHPASALYNGRLTRNPDGTIEVFVGPRPPERSDANWIRTEPEEKFEILFRFRGTAGPLLARHLPLPGVDEMT